MNRFFSGGGGIEIVTVYLANKFVHEGHLVYIVSFEDPNVYYRNKLDPKIKIVVLSLPVLNFNNIRIIYDILHNRKINFAINQWGERFSIGLLLLFSKKKLSIKILSLYHNQPGINTRVTSINVMLLKSKMNFIKLFLKIEKKIILKLVSWNMKISYLISDRYILLSKNYVDIFCKFIGISNPSKIEIIPNPITSTTQTNVSILKRKKIVHVARLIKYPKHPERIIELWETISTQVPEWSLEILGEGVEKQNLEAYCNEKKIERINFIGFVEPEPYYAEASILLLASDFEGFPLVLAEAMHYGVVPVVYQSFAALTDIIIDNENGLIVRSDENRQYSKSIMIIKVLSLINDEGLLKELSKNAVETSKHFSMENIYQKWMCLFSKILA
jgi:glycosyltransferase involved in cell wall biosynthesis